MKVVDLEVSKLIPYDFNNKEHDKEQVNMIANSIKEFGFNQPLVVDANNIVVVGHWRLLAAKELWLEKVPCVKLEDLSDEQVKKYRILDNKLNESDWAELNLRKDLDMLEDMNFGDLEIGKEDLFPELFEELGDKEKEEEPEIKFTEELGEENNYIVLFFDDSVDWLQAQSLFGLETVDALDSKEGYRRRGVGRVINGTEFMNKLLEYYNRKEWK